MAATETRQLGMVGLGRMGANLVRRLMRDGHQCVVYDRSPGPTQQLASEGATGTSTLDEFVAALTKPRAAWVMVPAGEITGNTINQLAERMEAGDIIIDGGNSYYRDDIARAAKLSEQGINLIDCGTSGGVWGLDRGFCLMLGGDGDVIDHLAPLFESLAPGVDAAPRTPGRTGPPEPCEQGWFHCGANGAGHFVKMVHNGIEYGIMAALAEGLNVLHNADVGTRKQDRRRGDGPAGAPRVLPVRHRHDVGVRALAPGQRHRLLAARPDGPLAVPVTRPVQLQRAGLGLRRGPLDLDRRDRRRRSRADPDQRAVLPVLLP